MLYETAVRSLDGDVAGRLEFHYGWSVTRTKRSRMTVTRTTDADRHGVTVPVNREVADSDGW